ncbi:MAG TPA: hypothetical protein VMS38_06050 [Pseudorhodoferax sp.]|nr:hypothetical protein [Pseudorhodoferax sp.]
MDIELDTQASARALVRFDHGSAPPACQPLAALQQRLPGHVNLR